MREIKFRAWLKSNKLMYNVLCVDIAEKKALIEHGDMKGYVKYPEEIKLMQCIGLKDKNGKDIYEGDIVNYRSWENEYNLEVVWIKEKARFGLKTKAGHINMKVWKYDWYEVIGNIYENRELLKDPQQATKR